MKNKAISENHLYKKVYSGGKKSVGRYVVVYVLRDLHAYRFKKAHPKKEYINRVGITVSSKIGGAVVRNRVKRIIRAAFSEVEKTGEGLKKGRLIVIVARDAAVRAKSGDIYTDLLGRFENLSMTEVRRDSGKKEPL